jgi:hypothetical protein
MPDEEVSQYSAFDKIISFANTNYRIPRRLADLIIRSAGEARERMVSENEESDKPISMHAVAPNEESARKSVVAIYCFNARKATQAAIYAASDASIADKHRANLWLSTWTW